MNLIVTAQKNEKDCNRQIKIINQNEIKNKIENKTHKLDNITIL